jgi:hypothetical protein
MIFNGRNWREERHERIMFNFIFNAHTQDVRDGAQQQSADGRVDAGREERVQLEKERSRRSAFMLFFPFHNNAQCTALQTHRRISIFKL